MGSKAEGGSFATALQGRLRRHEGAHVEFRCTPFVGLGLRRSVLCKRGYSSTKMFFLAQISFRIFGHKVTLTSPR